jgi:hypothetical protein
MFPHRHVRAGAVVLGLVCLAGCRSASPERLQAWKATPEGRERLVETLRDGAVAVPLRAQAAGALVEVGWGDRVEPAVAGAPFEERARLIPALAAEVAHGLDAADANRAWESREVLLALRRHATTDEGTRSVDAVLLPALERDLRAGRLAGGRLSLKEMLAAIGPAAVPVLTRAIADDKASFTVPVELLEKATDQAAREAGSAALVKRARVAATVSPELWKALSSLGGPPVIAFLQEVVEKRQGDTQLKAAEALAKLRADASMLPFAVRMARDLQAPPAVRQQMITVLERISSEDARKGLIGIIGSDPDPEFRFKAFASVVTSGTGRQLLAALEAFPPTVSYQAAQLQARVVEPITRIGYASRGDIFRALESRSPLARLVALWVMEKTSYGKDVPKVEKLTKDRGTIRGLPAGTTIGAEATRIVRVLKKKAS